MYTLRNPMRCRCGFNMGQKKCIQIWIVAVVQIIPNLLLHNIFIKGPRPPFFAKIKFLAGIWIFSFFLPMSTFFIPISFKAFGVKPWIGKGAFNVIGGIYWSTKSNNIVLNFSRRCQALHYQ